MINEISKQYGLPLTDCFFDQKFITGSVTEKTKAFFTNIISTILPKFTGNITTTTPTTVRELKNTPALPQTQSLTKQPKKYNDPYDKDHIVKEADEKFREWQQSSTEISASSTTPSDNAPQVAHAGFFGMNPNLLPLHPKMPHEDGRMVNKTVNGTDVDSGSSSESCNMRAICWMSLISSLANWGILSYLNKNQIYNISRIIFNEPDLSVAERVESIWHILRTSVSESKARKCARVLAHLGTWVTFSYAAVTAIAKAVVSGICTGLPWCALLPSVPLFSLQKNEPPTNSVESPEPLPPNAKDDSNNSDIKLPPASSPKLPNSPPDEPTQITIKDEDPGSTKETEAQETKPLLEGLHSQKWSQKPNAPFDGHGMAGPLSNYSSQRTSRVKTIALPKCNDKELKEKMDRPKDTVKKVEDMQSQKTPNSSIPRTEQLEEIFEPIKEAEKKRETEEQKKQMDVGYAEYPRRFLSSRNTAQLPSASNQPATPSPLSRSTRRL